ncbi:PAS and ANTAR domain-containing protein [Modestobacter lapidis]
MSNTSTVRRTASLSRGPAPGPGRSARPAAPPSTAAAGRYRYDVTTGRWWWSPETYAILGLPPASTPPTADLLLQAVHRDDRPRVRQALADSCTTGAPFVVEHRVAHPDGPLRTVVLVGEPETAPGGGTTALCGMLVDVTDGRPAEPATPDEQVRVLETEVEQLRQAMSSRAAIEQAKGILMLLMGCGDQVAFDLLAHISSHTHRKVRDVAGAIITSASGGNPLPDDVRAILHDACPPGSPHV